MIGSGEYDEPESNGIPYIDGTTTNDRANDSLLSAAKKAAQLAGIERAQHDRLVADTPDEDELYDRAGNAGVEHLKKNEEAIQESPHEPLDILPIFIGEYIKGYKQRLAPNGKADRVVLPDKIEYAAQKIARIDKEEALSHGKSLLKRHIMYQAVKHADKDLKPDEMSSPDYFNRIDKFVDAYVDVYERYIPARGREEYTDRSPRPGPFSR